MNRIKYKIIPTLIQILITTISLINFIRYPITILSLLNCIFWIGIAWLIGLSGIVFDIIITDKKER